VLDLFQKNIIIFFFIFGWY